MQNKARTLWTTLAAVLIGAAAFVTVGAQAQDARQPARERQAHSRMSGPGHGLVPELARLNLTDEQRDQIRAIVREARNSASTPGNNLGDLQRELRAAIFADTPDQAKIDQLKASIAEAQAAALNARVAVDLKIAEVLTPEQRAAARELRAHGPRRGPGRGMRQ